MYGSTKREDFRWVEGYEDHTLDLAFVWDQNEDLTGVVINLACPSQVTESESYISADFWHEVRCELRQRHAEDIFVLAQCAAAGDQSPHLQLYERPEAAMRKKRGFTERQEIARRIANAVDDVLPIARDDIQTDVPFAHTLETLSLPARRITEDEYEQRVAEHEQLQADKPAPDDMTAYSRWFWSNRRYERAIEAYSRQDDSPHIDTDVHVVRLGDTAFATNQFELFLDFGLRIKARSKAQQTFIIQLTATRTGQEGTYLPTKRAVAAKSYGAQAVDNVVGPEGGQVLVEQTLGMIDRMWE